MSRSGSPSGPVGVGSVGWCSEDGAPAFWGRAGLGFSQAEESGQCALLFASSDRGLCALATWR